MLEGLWTSDPGNTPDGRGAEGPVGRETTGERAPEEPMDPDGRTPEGKMPETAPGPGVGTAPEERTPDVRPPEVPRMPEVGRAPDGSIPDEPCGTPEGPGMISEPPLEAPSKDGVGWLPPDGDPAVTQDEPLLGIMRDSTELASEGRPLELGAGMETGIAG